MKVKKVMFDDYELDSNEKKVLGDALDAYARIFQGQFSQLGHIFYINMTQKLKKSTLDKVVSLLEQAQVIIFGDVATYWRIVDNIVARSALTAYRLSNILEGNWEEAENVQKYYRWGYGPPKNGPTQS